MRSRSLILLIVLLTSIPAVAQFTVDTGRPRKTGEFTFSGGLQTHQLESSLMRRPVSYSIFLPIGYSVEANRERYPVVFLLHGLGGNHTNWAEKTDFTWALPDLKAVIVMPDGADSWYTDSSADPDHLYESYIIKELIPEIDRKFRTTADREHRAIAGLSMGGYGAIKFGLKYPELFSLAGSFSGVLRAASATDKEIPGAVGRSIMALFGPVGSEVRAANDLFSMVRGLTAEKKKQLPFLYLDCGAEDSYFQNNQDFAALLLEKKVPHEFRQLPGGHSWKYWGAQVKEFLQLAMQRLGSSDHPATVKPKNIAHPPLATNIGFPASPRQTTIIRNSAAARMLLGRHRFSLQWVSWDHFGVATITNRGGVYSITGEQRGRGRQISDFVSIEGTITSVDAKEFAFKGTIVTQVSHINGGKPCKRDGEFTFRITGNRKYWRLQQMDNPCDPVADYLDIFFR